MDWLQVFTIVGSTGGFCYLMYREAKEDRREFKEDRKEFRQAIDEDRKEFRQAIDEIRREQKDFHGRMCALEEKYILMMERWMEGRK